MTETSGINATIASKIYPNNAGRISASVLAAVLGDGGMTGWVAGQYAPIVSTIATLRALSTNHASAVLVIGYYTAGDSQASIYWRNDSDTTSADDGGGVIIGADLKRWYLVPQANGAVYITQYGGVGDGVTNNTSNFVSAYARFDTVIVPEGTFVGSVILASGQRLTGTNRQKSILKAPPGANSSAVAGYNAYSLFGTNPGSPTTVGANRTQVDTITIDGNRANVSTSGDGIAIWGYGTIIREVTVQNCRSNGIRTEWTDGNVSMEGNFIDIKIDTVGLHGWSFAGPHDSDVRSITVVDASQNADNAAYGFYVGVDSSDNGNGRFYNIHAWHRSPTPNRMAFALYSASGGSQFVGCHFEGGRSLVSLSGTNDTFVGCQFYGCFGPNGTPFVSIGGNNNVFEGCTFNNTGQGTTAPNSSSVINGDVYAIYFNGAGNVVRGCQFLGFSQIAPFGFGGGTGLNWIEGYGYCNSGGSTAWATGAPASTDAIEYVQGGTNINWRKPPYRIYVANDTAAAAAGVPIGGEYVNTGSGAVNVRLT